MRIIKSHPCTDQDTEPTQVLEHADRVVFHDERDYSLSWCSFVEALVEQSQYYEEVREVLGIRSGHINLPGFPDDAASVTFTRPQSRLVLEKFKLNSLVICIATLMSSLRL